MQNQGWNMFVAAQAGPPFQPPNATTSHRQTQPFNNGDANLMYQHKQRYGLPHHVPNRRSTPVQRFIEPMNTDNSMISAMHEVFPDSTAAIGVFDLPQPTTHPVPQFPPAPTNGSRRGGGKTLSWVEHKEQIEKYYLKDDKPLHETMALMERHGFKASLKQYKEKFQEWGWHKNFTVPTAQYLVAVAEKRKLENDKETRFFLSGQIRSLEQVQRAAQRPHKRARKEDDDTFVGTPGFITYNTPSSAGVPSPEHVRLDQTVAAATPPTWAPETHSSSSNQAGARLTWSGRTKAEFDAMRDDAQRLERLGHTHEAGVKYREALAGLQHLMPFLHDETISLAYQVASFYAKNDRMRDADAVLEWLNTSAVEAWGIGDKRTIDHLERVVDMLQSWSREEDAVPLICRLGKAPTSTNADAEMVEESHDVAMIEFQLAITKVQVKTQPRNAEPMLLQLVEQCNLSPEKFPGQTLRAWTMLIDFYQQAKEPGQVNHSLDRAKASFSLIANMGISWSFSLCNVALGFISKFVDSARYENADEMYNKVVEEAENAFGVSSDSTIRLITNIGMQYQKSQRWEDARPFFERAYAASMAAYGFDDDLTLRLEEGLENCHYEPSSTTMPLRSETWQYWNINRRAKRNLHRLRMIDD